MKIAPVRQAKFINTVLRCRSEGDRQGIGWSCFKMCQRSKWKSCGSKMHRMCGSHRIAVHYQCISRTGNIFTFTVMTI